MEILNFLLLPAFLWSISLYILSNWKWFWKFSILNGFLIIIYIPYILFGEIAYLSHDEYGIGRLMLLLLLLIIHAITVLIFAVIRKVRMNYRSRNQQLVITKDHKKM